MANLYKSITIGKMRCIVKRPDELYGHMTNITPSLENLQKIVQGYIEAVPLQEGVIILCNEMGKIQGLDWNIPHPHNKHDILVGTIIVCGVKGEHFVSLPPSFEMSTWKGILEKLRIGQSV